MYGHYVADWKREEPEAPTGRLSIEVANLPEFEKLIEQAKQEADQLQRTINQLRNFDLKIDFGIKRDDIREHVERETTCKISREHVSIGKIIKKDDSTTPV